MIASYVSKIFLQHMPLKSVRQPRKRYIQYMQDLYKLFKEDITDSTFTEGSQYAYSEIGDELFIEAKKTEKLDDIDLFIISHWAHEFGPEYASCGPYLLHKHGFDCNNFDVCDQGTMSFLTALKIILQHQAQGVSEKALLLVMEQNTVPRNKSNHDLIPLIAGGALFWIDITPDQQGKPLEIIAIDFIHEAKIIEQGWNALVTIREICSKFNIAEEQLCVFVSKASFAYKSLQYATTASEEKQLFVLSFMDHRPGMLPLVEAVQNVLQEENKLKRYSLFFHEDIESAEIGYLLLKSGD